jgi:hypothetical protein
MSMFHVIVVFVGVQKNFIRPILTVQRFLAERNATDILLDPKLPLATRAVDDHSGLKSKDQLQAEMVAKAAAAKHLIDKYTPGMYVCTT